MSEQKCIFVVISPTASGEVKNEERGQVAESLSVFEGRCKEFFSYYESSKPE